MTTNTFAIHSLKSYIMLWVYISLSFPCTQISPRNFSRLLRICPHSLSLPGAYITYTQWNGFRGSGSLGIFLPFTFIAWVFLINFHFHIMSTSITNDFSADLVHICPRFHFQGADILWWTDFLLILGSVCIFLILLIDLQLTPRARVLVHLCSLASLHSSSSSPSQSPSACASRSPHHHHHPHQHRCIVNFILIPSSTSPWQFTTGPPLFLQALYIKPIWLHSPIYPDQPPPFSLHNVSFSFLLFTLFRDAGAIASLSSLFSSCLVCILYFLYLSTHPSPLHGNHLKYRNKLLSSLVQDITKVPSSSSSSSSSSSLSSSS